MKISEFIKSLEKLKENEGDIDMVAANCSYVWNIEKCEDIGEIKTESLIDENTGEESVRKYFEICTE